MRRIIVLTCIFFATPDYAKDSCHYQTYRWNTTTQKAEDFETIVKRYDELNPDEVDNLTGCSVCIEDQQEIQIGNLQPIRMCRRFAGKVEWILKAAIAEGFAIKQLRGYRVGRTRGEIDAEGKRMEFSNHSYGIAIDINGNSNGLYENCVEFGQQCVLRRGGRWNPGQNPESIPTDGILINLMKGSGFKWGGEIAGRQKDFMHFSVSGY